MPAFFRCEVSIPGERLQDSRRRPTTTLDSTHHCSRITRPTFCLSHHCKRIHIASSLPILQARSINPADFPTTIRLRCPHHTSPPRETDATTLNISRANNSAYQQSRPAKLSATASSSHHAFRLDAPKQEPLSQCAAGPGYCECHGGLYPNLSISRHYEQVQQLGSPPRRECAPQLSQHARCRTSLQNRPFQSPGSGRPSRSSRSHATHCLSASLNLAYLVELTCRTIISPFLLLLPYSRCPG